MASVAAPAVLRVALRRCAAIRVQAASRVLVGVERARQVSGAVGAPGRGAIGRPHPHRSVSLDAARRRAGAICSTRRAMASPIIVWAQPSHTPGRFPKIEVFELPFVPSRRALVSSKAIDDYAPRQPGGRIPRGASDLLFVLRPRRAARQPAGPHHRGDQGPAAARADPFRRSKRCIGSARSPCRCRARSCRWRSPSTWSTAASIRGTWCRRSSSTICSRRTPSSPTSSLSTTTFVLAMNKAAYDRLPRDLKTVIDDNSGQPAASMAGTMWDVQAAAVADMVCQPRRSDHHAVAGGRRALAQSDRAGGRRLAQRHEGTQGRRRQAPRQRPRAVGEIRGRARTATRAADAAVATARRSQSRRDDAAKSRARPLQRRHLRRQRRQSLRSSRRCPPPRRQPSRRPRRRPPRHRRLRRSSRQRRSLSRLRRQLR